MVRSANRGSASRTLSIDSWSRPAALASFVVFALLAGLVVHGCGGDSSPPPRTPSTDSTPSSKPPEEETPADTSGAPRDPMDWTGMIAFASNRDGDFQIWVISTTQDSLGLIDVTRITAEGQNIGPAWSPDGNRIAFVSDREGSLDIFLMNADGSDQTNLTKHPSDDGGGGPPAWSPDGARIAFDSDRSGNGEIYVMSADGSASSNLTSHPADDAGPSWSPDGRRIAFASDRDGDLDIYLMNADGSEVVNVTEDPADDGRPSWSPDGSHMAFVSDRDGNREMYVMSADGSDVRRLTDDAGVDETPVWSPDGQLIAFSSDRDGDSEIYVMDARGSRVSPLPGTSEEDLFPSWSDQVDYVRAPVLDDLPVPPGARLGKDGWGALCPEKPGFDAREYEIDQSPEDVLDFYRNNVTPGARASGDEGALGIAWRIDGRQFSVVAESDRRGTRFLITRGCSE